MKHTPKSKTTSCIEYKTIGEPCNYTTDALSKRITPSVLSFRLSSCCFLLGKWNSDDRVWLNMRNVLCSSPRLVPHLCFCTDKDSKATNIESDDKKYQTLNNLCYHDTPGRYNVASSSSHLIRGMSCERVGKQKLITHFSPGMLSESAKRRSKLIWRCFRIAFWIGWPVFREKKFFFTRSIMKDGQRELKWMEMRSNTKSNAEKREALFKFGGSEKNVQWLRAAAGSCVERH